MNLTKKKLKEYVQLLQKMTNVTITVVQSGEYIPGLRATLDVGYLYMPIEHCGDVKQLLIKFQKQFDKNSKTLISLFDKLNNKQFLDKAPEQIVNKDRQKYSKLLKQTIDLGYNITELQKYTLK